MPGRAHLESASDVSIDDLAGFHKPGLGRPPLPVLRPKLPSTRQLVPYLREIEERRLYSNGGPLTIRLQGELEGHLGCEAETIVMTASATGGLTTALLALNLPVDSVCLMPSWTFVATPHSVLAAGLKPWFLDVDRSTWTLNIATVKQVLAGMGCAAKAIVVISPFGAPIDVTSWQNFQEETGMAVIIDAAAGFDTVRPSSLISVVSLHATKILAAGEGGFVITPSMAARDRVRSCGNFGFQGTRVAQCRAINSKMSEYHAAVGLASLEVWPATRLRHLQIASWYRRALAGLPGVTLQPGYGEGWACGSTNIVLEGDSAESISVSMAREGIETRMWWGSGCHRQPAFADCGRCSLTETEYLAAHVLGLPHFVDMEKAEVDFVVRTLGKALKSRASGRRPG